MSKEKENTDDNIQDIDYTPVDEENEEQDNEIEDSNISLQTIPKGEIAKFDNFANVEDVKQFAIQLGIRKDPATVAQIIIRGRELGIPAMQAFDNIYIVNGRATLSVHLVNFLIKRAGYEIRTVQDNEYIDAEGKFSKFKILEGPNKSLDRCCTIEFTWRSKLTNEIKREEYTYWISEAAAAGLTNKDTWKSYTKQLLWARTLVFGARRICAEALQGFYETGEIADIEGLSYKVDENNNAINIH